MENRDKEINNSNDWIDDIAYIWFWFKVERDVAIGNNKRSFWAEL